MTITTADVVGLLIATVGGAAVGLERQWSGHAVGPFERFAGLRTFTMLGGLAGVAGLLWRMGLGGFAVVLLASAGALVVVAYGAGSRKDVDATTEVAAVVVLAAGLLAGLASLRLASAIFALTSLVLVEKSRLHAAVARIDDVTLPAAFRFTAMSVVVLPLLPEGPVTALGLRPRQVWTLVLLLSGLSFAGYLARKLVGRDRGYLATGALGGLVSSTSITMSFARLSQGDPHAAGALAAGTIAANAMLFPRVLLTVSVLNGELLTVLWSWFVAPFLVAVAALVVSLRAAPPSHVDDPALRNPLQLVAALKMAAMFQVVMLLVDAASARLQGTGLLTLAAGLGLTDIDALTVAMAGPNSATLSPTVEATAIVVGVFSNTVLKLTLALLWGGGRFRLFTGAALAAVGGALVLQLVVR